MVKKYYQGVSKVEKKEEKKQQMPLNFSNQPLRYLVAGGGACLFMYTFLGPITSTALAIIAGGACVFKDQLSPEIKYCVDYAITSATSLIDKATIKFTDMIKEAQRSARPYSSYVHIK